MTISKQELLDALEEFAKELGETPTAKQMDEHDDYPSRSTYRRQFGSWNEALIEAGLEPNQKKEYDDDELLRHLREFAKELDETPTAEQMDAADERPGSTTYVSRFESWNKAVGEAGLEPNQKNDISKEAIQNTADQATGSESKGSGSDDLIPSNEWNSQSPSSGLRSFEESPDRVPKNQSQSRTQTYETNPFEKAKSHESHEDVLDLLVKHLKPEFNCFDVEGGSDLIATDEVESVLQVESKSLSGSTKEEKQIRTALGQLREYRYSDIICPERFTDLSLTQALLFDREPSDKYRKFVEWLSEEGIFVFWFDEDELDGTETSMTTLRTLIE